MDWEDAQKLYDQLMKSRGELALLMLQNPKLRIIQDDACKAITDQLDRLEEYVAPHRTTSARKDTP